MIVVMVEYDPDYKVLGTGPSPVAQIPRHYFYSDFVLDLRDLTESIVGDVFAEEQDKVEVRMIPYGEHDDFERPLFFTIDIEDPAIHHDLDVLVRQFICEMNERLPQAPIFRVWARRINGSFSDSR